MTSPGIFHLVGLMSGTSGDGLDMAYCRFEFNGQWKYEIIRAETEAFPNDLGKKLQNAPNFSGLQLSLLDREFGNWMGQAVKKFCQKFQLNADAIASHGHTVFHQPEKKFTLQIGNGWSLSRASGMPVICDFRSLDIQLGGQGAPLAPIGDHYLFPKYDFCLNLGGIANISMMKENQRIAFDISPFNLLLNYLAEKKGMPYDDQGKLARNGMVDPELLNALNHLSYYEQKGAKSLGREDLEKDFLPLIKNMDASPENISATLVEHYSIQISKSIKEYSLKKEQQVLVSGGGAYHTYFIEKLQHRLGKDIKVVVPEKSIIDYKEALIFAFLGVLRMRNEVNTFKSVTGASQNSCGGLLFDANK
ncbi:anhydro-N-acetylmuramic acid kinase [Echinicola jeungdonensis]|uniref:Anhydro-N-acetylmuramic acid kinase n=1 Tax=Echinicola jeungdonensis TaxID=709343 RepID=A0ABV5J1Y3_9BACT|nr:anhydro-N-acetylmuramic acid kinase [Echinicola jeungdonensis]MDN3668986.1 anhydro-N-acetylmuramic acid kinase [Echinicola jeungdonensis]